MKTRIISGVIATIIAAVILLLHETIVFYFAISTLSILMIYELYSATNCLKYKTTTAITFIFAGIMPFFFYGELMKYRYLFLTLCLIAIFVTFLIEYKTLPFEKLCIMITTSVLITLSMNSLIQIKLFNEKHGMFLLVISLCGAWFADTGAYFTGTLFGKHKLCPEISPKKSVEGLIGGTITNALLFVLIAFIYSKISMTNDIAVSFNYVYLFILGMACSLLGLLGDLSASLLKRQCSIKDFGNIMPGHGGVLDRFDSVLFVVPFMSIAVQYLEIIK